MAVEGLAVMSGQRHGLEEGGHGGNVGLDYVAVPYDFGGGEVEERHFLLRVSKDDAKT